MEVIMKKLIALVLLLAATTCLFAAKEKKPPKVEKTMPFKKGLNLSNWIELYRNENPNFNEVPCHIGQNGHH